jgi:hypothetical protein
MEPLLASRSYQRPFSPTSKAGRPDPPSLPRGILLGVPEPITSQVFTPSISVIEYVSRPRVPGSPCLGSPPMEACVKQCAVDPSHEGRL